MVGHIARKRLSQHLNLGPIDSKAYNYMYSERLGEHGAED